jgi:hypothetical protein
LLLRLLPYTETKLQLSIDPIKFDRILTRLVNDGLRIRPQSIWENHREYRVSRKDNDLKIIGPFGGNRQWCLQTMGAISQTEIGVVLNLRMRLCNEHLLLMMATLGFMLFMLVQIFSSADGGTISVSKLPILFPLGFMYFAIVFGTRYEASKIVQLLDRTFNE